MTNLEYLKLVKKKDEERKNEIPIYGKFSEWEIEYRRTKALEINAETLIDINDNLSAIMRHKLFLPSGCIKQH